ncbi:methyltransferase domain-containing protein [Bosea massiliensis]|jgi:SAM-dependent methyltransferase|uniref:Methyltransferase domain-containing protein n=1 Tax=Bosea massiliensis TaxID=151419 RepID=A0ABW0NX25_9HYPH
MHGIAAALLSHVPLVAYPYRGENCACNLCGGTAATVVCRYDRRLKPLTTVSCDGCGLMRTDPMPSEEELGRYYASSYRLDYQFARNGTPPRLHLKRSRAEATARFALLGDYLEPASRILDLGSGSGEFLDILARAGHRATGIEPGRDFARYARAAYGADVIESSWQAADLPATSFDLISAQHVLEHLREPVDALRRLAHWLAQDGFIHVEVPNAAATRHDPLQQFHFAHVHHFTPDTLVAAAERAGLVFHAGGYPSPTTMIFRKLAPGETPVRRAPPQARSQLRLGTLSPGRYLLSGRWAMNAINRARRFLQDSGQASTVS